ncbi:hypothetical protein D5Q54_18265 [Vibrio cholerae]|nr:hypothetical protein [Vibrio cholerae]
MQGQMNAEELAYFYNSIGKAIWQMQYVEQSLGQMLLIMSKGLKPNGLSPDDAETILLTIQKKTLGAIVNDICKEELLPPELLKRLEWFNAERRWLVHKSVIESSKDLYNSTTRNEVFIRIDAFTKEAIQLHKDLQDSLYQYMHGVGVNTQLFNDIAEQELRKLKGFA